MRNRGTLVGSLCHADPQGDWASVVTALGGYVIAKGSRGQRNIPVSQFVSGPFQNTLAIDEIAIEAVIPAPKGDPSGGYLKLERRVGDFATAGVALGAGDPPAARSSAPASGHRRRWLDDRRLRRRPDPRRWSVDRPSKIGQAADLAAQAARPRTDHRGSAEFKRHIIHTFVVRLLDARRRVDRQGGLT